MNQATSLRIIMSPAIALLVVGGGFLLFHGVRTGDVASLLIGTLAFWAASICIVTSLCQPGPPVFRGVKRQATVMHLPSGAKHITFEEDGRLTYEGLRENMPVDVRARYDDLVAETERLNAEIERTFGSKWS